MSTSEASTSYYIRVRGKILGPYSITQLKTLRARGQFSRANEVSTDRTNWQSAATIDHLFGVIIKTKTPAPQEPDVTIVAAPTGPPSRSVQPTWFYAVGSEQYGPVTLLELRGLIKSGELTDEDVVWKDGMPDWVPVCEIAELKAVSKSNSVGPNSQPTPSFVAHPHFCYACGSPTDERAEVCPKCGVRQSHGASSSPKDRLTAALLAFFLGGIGVHHFYLGNTALGVLYLVFCWTFIPAIAALIDFIVLLCMSDARFASKYCGAK